MKDYDKIQTVVFFFINPIRASRRESFQLERLESQGYDIFIIDATKYFNRDMEMSSSVIHKNTIECSTKEDFVNFRNSLGLKRILYVSSDRYIEVAAPIFNLLVKKVDKLLTFKTKSFSDKDFTSNPVRKVIDKSIKFLDSFLPLHLLGYYYKLRYGIVTPDYFLCSTGYLIPTKAYLTVKKSNRIIVHADDINETFKNKTSVIDPGKKIGVFLDQGVPFLSRTHPLIYPEDSLPENYLETYYEEVGSTLNQLKEHLKLDEIVISMHPSTVHFQEELKDILSGFPKFVWKTPELIKDSFVVLTHCTTALSYAVYYKKPIILLESNILSNLENFNKGVEFFKQNLNLKSVLMDENFEPVKEVEVDQGCYDKYLKRFLKDSEVEENAYYYAINRIINKVNAND